MVTLLVLGFAIGGSSAAGAAPCFDPADPDDIRLWPGPAPGASGDDACRDIPFLKVFRAPGQDIGPALVLIPGGGYDRLSNAREQEPVAAYFARHLHITTFVLSYRLVQADGTYRYPVPLWDGRRAVRLVRARAPHYGIDPRRIGIFGFSAGGHLASVIAFRPGDDFGLSRRDATDDVDDGVAVLGLGYPVITMDAGDAPASASARHLLSGYRGAERAALERRLSAQNLVGPHAPPVFLFDGLDDQRVSPENSRLLARSLQAAGVPAAVYWFDHGPHGAGLATGVPGESAWPDLFQQWLRERGFLP
ncbi:alpha/beta hydrolase [Nitrospirillum sp. BR 11752]|uniref:alpha/beta hydrolase n=1 Tax=Nitrospirillum sp. BR 11752 TaxID=3104293 RepID=UPI002EB74520|nr:alpha/beta hydrolase [Nitrospirillum sp. BR 11752]